MTEHHDAAKHAVDALSLMTVFGTLMNILPSIAALASLIWSVIRIYETRTVQAWIRKQKGN